MEDGASVCSTYDKGFETPIPFLTVTKLHTAVTY